MPALVKPIVLIGAGGIGAPAALALVRAGITTLRIVDDDAVELSNLHRQILYEDADVGSPKLGAFDAALRRERADLEIELIGGRALPDTALDLVSDASVVLDATDNFASRFLLADAAMIASVPIVHAAAVRWHATVMAVPAGGRPCYRCLFEDIPSGQLVDCATAGVLGPVCGISGAVAADRVLRILAGEADAFGHIVTYEGVRDHLRQVAIAPRKDCVLCGDGASIGSIDASRYMGPECEAG